MVERRADNQQIVGSNPGGDKLKFCQNSIPMGIKTPKLGLRLGRFSKWYPAELATESFNVNQNLLILFCEWHSHEHYSTCHSLDIAIGY